MNKIKCPNCGDVFTIDDANYASIVSQIKNSEFEKELALREKAFIEKSKIAADLEKEKEAKIAEKRISDLEAKIREQETIIKSANTEKELAVTKALADKEKELSKKKEEITELNSRLNIEKKTAESNMLSLKQQHELEIKAKNTEIEYYKDLKVKMSTKLLGETLEQHCQIAFNQIRMTAFPRAYFEKDNVVSKESGSKGDFIFKDYIDDTDIPFVSIMFEMKNENETTATKHKNEDFFKELDKDRNEKGCEYAVLVSMLESDNEFYNAGIVDVSYQYPKMYVIRPQCFISMITLLRNAALNSIEYQKQVIQYKEEHLDITNFEAAVKAVADKITADYEKAGALYEQVDKMCEDMIKKISAFREIFRKGQGHIQAAQNQLENLSIRKLTRNNPTMKEKFGIDK